VRAPKWYVLRAIMVVDESLPQLLFLLWNRSSRELSEEEAFALYEAHPQWVSPETMTQHERRTFDALVERFGRGIYLG
jgi:hypothetical protein